MKLSRKGLLDRAAWDAVGVALPQFDVQAMCERTQAEPTWLHVGAGNLFRAFPCAAAQRLLDDGLYDRGVIACNPHDVESIDRAFTPYDNLTMLAILRADGRIDKRVIASVAEVVKGQTADDARLQALFSAPSLQMVSLTVTEKAYQPDNGTMRLLCKLLLHRFEQGAVPVALVSMDNCAHNGEKLECAIISSAKSMVSEGSAPDAFLDYLRKSVSYPNTMIDKITPHPDAEVAKMLQDIGFEDAEIIKTAMGTITAPYVNAEQAEYLVIEDHFPNGRPPLEKAGIYFTDRETVDKVEKMKVGTCLNPLHTALALLGSLLGFTKISTEMGDADISRFINKLAYEECLPVVQDPGILSPNDFLHEVLTKRVNNPFLPDTPQRIATDTSQKIPVRFGHTIMATENKQSLCCIPFVIASWFRYLVGVDDMGNTFVPSTDPRLSEVKARMAGGLSDELLSDASLFGADLVATGLAERVRLLFNQMMEGEGAVRRTLTSIHNG